jgi:hypothetical protein
MQGELVSGLRSLDDGFIPPIIDLSVLDRKIMVSNENAIRWTQKLLHEEGLFAGVSAGAIAYVAARIAGELDEGNVVFLVPDDGWKYLSSGVYTKPYEELENVDSTVWWWPPGRRPRSAQACEFRSGPGAARTGSVCSEGAWVRRLGPPCDHLERP